MMNDNRFESWASDQQDQDLWRESPTTVRKIDFLLDDRGGAMEQQLVTFLDKVNELQPILNNYCQTYCC